jgi:UDP-N-acetylmuramyl tripeptide synthase
MIASLLKPGNQRTTFGILPQNNEMQVRDSIINDLIYCPKCGHTLTSDFVRYHHIGRHHCEACGFTSLPLDVYIEKLDVPHRLMIVCTKEERCQFKLVGSNITDAYNMVAMISVFVRLGKSLSEISTIVEELSIVESRFDEIKIGHKRVIGILGKDQNPVANSRVYDFIRRETSWGNIAILFANEVYAHVEKPHEVENMAWIYDVNMEYLNQENIVQLVVGGWRRYDFKARMRMAGIPESKIVLVKREEDEVEAVDLTVDTVILLYSTKNIPTANRMKKEIALRFEKEVAR